MMVNRKVAFITGASGAIGSSIARLLHESNIYVVLGYNFSFDSVCKLLESIGKDKNSIINCDVSSRESVINAFEEIYKKYGRIDYLVNVAAFTKDVPIDEIYSIDESTIDSMMNVNFKGTVWCCLEIIEWMKKIRDSGVNSKSRCSIVNISSNAIKTHNASNIFYISTKSALQLFTESMALYYGNYARLNCVAPGLILSNITKNRFNKSKDYVLSKTPTGELAKPEDIAIVVKMLLLDSSAVSGQTIYVDGGRTIGD